MIPLDGNGLISQVALTRIRRDYCQMAVKAAKVFVDAIHKAFPDANCFADWKELLEKQKVGETREVEVSGKDGIVGGHGGDMGIMSARYHSVCGEYVGKGISDISTSVANRMIVFAAEKARKEGLFSISTHI